MRYGRSDVRACAPYDAYEKCIESYSRKSEEKRLRRDDKN
jgi:hypothetical protein